MRKKLLSPPGTHHHKKTVICVLKTLMRKGSTGTLRHHPQTKHMILKSLSILHKSCWGLRGYLSHIFKGESDLKQNILYIFLPQFFIPFHMV